MTEEQVIRNAAKLYKMRDAARTVWGEKYQARLTQYLNVMARYMVKEGCNEIEAFIRMSKRVQDNHPGADTSWVIIGLAAAAVELTERNKGVSNGVES